MYTYALIFLNQYTLKLSEETKYKKLLFKSLFQMVKNKSSNATYHIYNSALVAKSNTIKLSDMQNYYKLIVLNECLEFWTVKNLLKPANM